MHGSLKQFLTDLHNRPKKAAILHAIARAPHTAAKLAWLIKAIERKLE
jgi:hypothetical protein